MSHRAAWWPAAVAGLLMAGGGSWLWRALPPAITSPLPLAAQTVPEQLAAPRPPDEAGALDTPRAAPASVAATAEEEEPQEIPADTAIRFAAYTPLADDTLAHPMRAHRYVGTLGGQAIVLWLSVGADSVAGSWYYRTARQPHERILAFRRRRGGRAMLSEEIEANIPTTGTTAEWQLRWPPGRVLTAQRRAVPGTSWQAVPLHKDYSQAVPYQLLRLTAHGSYCHAEPGRPQPYYSSEFVRVLSADSLRLARWQAPPPAARRDSLRRGLRRDGACQQITNSTAVTLDDYGLLSYNVWTQADYYGNHPGNSQAGFIVDLRTGRLCLVQELLRPGTEPALLKLLARHLRHDYPELAEEDDWHWKTVPPLPSSFTLTPSGLSANYGDYALTAYSSHYANTTTIPYAELRPLVRPGTPLARLLAARGLW